MVSFGFFAIIGLYVGINALILFWMVYSTARVKRRHSITAAGSAAGNETLSDAAKAELGFARSGMESAVENIPIALILLILMGGLGAPAYAVHVMGAVLTLGRLAHAAYFTFEGLPASLRSFGAFATALMIVLTALSLIGHSLGAILF